MGAIRDLIFGGAEPSSSGDDNMAAARIGRGVNQLAEAEQRAAFAITSQDEVWDIFDQIGEVRNAVAKQGRQAGYARLGVFKLEADGSKRRVQMSSEMPAGIREVTTALASPQGGQRGLLERFIMLYRVAGFMEVQAHKSGNTITGISLRSADEIDRRDGKPFLVSHPRGKYRTWGTIEGADLGQSTTPIDVIGQIWQPHPRFSDMASSPLYSMRTTCRQLITLQDSILARLRQRATMAGIHFFPSNLTNVHVPDTAPASIRNSQSGLAKIAWNLQQSIQNPQSPESLVGILMSGSPDDIQGYRYEDGYRSLLESDIELSEKLLSRVIGGLDSQNGAIEGRGDQNHFGSWQDAAEEMSANIIPEVENFCFALSKFLLWPNIDAALRGQYEIWFDMTEAQTSVNRGEAVRRGVEAGEVSAVLLGDIAGARSDERMDVFEKIRRLGEKVNDPWMALQGLDGVPDDVMERAKEHSASKTGPGGNITDSDRPASAPGVGEPGSPEDDRSDRPGSTAPVD